jgi:hypothetical protein
MFLGDNKEGIRLSSVIMSSRFNLKQEIVIVHHSTQVDRNIKRKNPKKELG